MAVLAIVELYTKIFELGSRKAAFDFFRIDTRKKISYAWVPLANGSAVH